MEEKTQFPLFTNCKLTVSKKVFINDGKLLKLITDKLQFKITGFDPFVIEKDCVLHQDLSKLVDALQAAYEVHESRHQTSKQDAYCYMRDNTYDSSMPLVEHASGECHQLEKKSNQNGTEERACKQNQSRTNAFEDCFQLRATEKSSAEVHDLEHTIDTGKETDCNEDRREDLKHIEKIELHRQRTDLSQTEPLDKKKVDYSSYPAVISKKAVVFSNGTDCITRNVKSRHDRELQWGSAVNENKYTLPQLTNAPAQVHHLSKEISKNETSEREYNKKHTSASPENHILNSRREDSSNKVHFMDSKYENESAERKPALLLKDSSNEVHFMDSKYENESSERKPALLLKDSSNEIHFMDSKYENESAERKPALPLKDSNNKVHFMDSKYENESAERKPALLLKDRSNNVHFMDSKYENKSAERKPAFVLKDQDRKINFSENIHREDDNTAKMSKLLKGKMFDAKTDSDQHKREAPRNENAHGINKSLETHALKKMSHSVRSAQEQEVSSSLLHERSHSRKTNSVFYSNTEKKHFIKSDYSKLKVQVYKGNITELKVDCIVNATNELLQHFGGVALAIAQGAGPSLVKECDDFINAGNSVATTDNFVSTGGNLPASYVMHAVGPMWGLYKEKSKSQCFDHLRHTVLKCLVEAGRRGMTSIALPSISAAMSGVPRDQCARCYIEAVKHFDVFNAGEENALLEIHFVDVDDTMVKLISDCLIDTWSTPCDPEILLKDCDFAKNISHTVYDTEVDNYHRQTFQKNKATGDTRTSLSVKTGELAAASALITAEKPEMRTTYHIGESTLQVDCRFAFDYTPDIIITIGKHFDKLSGVHGCRMSSNLKQSVGMSSKEDAYEFFNVSDPNGPQAHLLCEVYPEPDNVDNILEAFKNLKTAIKISEIRNMKALVLTSSILYAAEPTNKKQQKGKINVLDRRRIGKFAQCLYDFLEEICKDSQEGICFTVVGNEDALPTIEKVVESHNVKRTTSGGGDLFIDSRAEMTSLNADAGDPVSYGNGCEFCTESKLCWPVRCCRRLLCQDCEQRASECPFCSKFWRIITGDQPQGSMTVSQISDHADGYESTNTWKIEYSFPSGTQKEYHPSPGMRYGPARRTAYLPANLHGLQVLVLLRLAFIRSLTFTIGHSLRRSIDDVIVWNEISHKTNLHGGMYGYPDPKYLDQVIVELASKGVKLDTLTVIERRQLEKFSSDLANSRSFSDL